MFFIARAAAPILPGMVVCTITMRHILHRRELIKAGLDEAALALTGNSRILARHEPDDQYRRTRRPPGRQRHHALV